MEPQKPLPDDEEPLSLAALEELARIKTLDGEKKLRPEIIRHRLRAKKAEAEIVELKARLAEGADAKTVEQLTELRHRDSVRAAIEQYDFTARGARSKAVAELLTMTKLDESGALVLVDEESGESLPLDEKLLRELLPGELLNSYTGGGSGARGPEEAAPPHRGARDEDDELIEKARRSSRFYEANRERVIAAEKRRQR